MHAQQNIEQILQQLQDETHKKHPEISRECEIALKQLREIEQSEADEKFACTELTRDQNNENTELSFKEEKKTDEVICNTKLVLLLHIKLQPFLFALNQKYKPNAYFYDALYNLIANNVLQEKQVVALVSLLITHLNEDFEHTIKIIQCFSPLLYYDIFHGEISFNVLYAFINLLNIQNQHKNNAKGMCNLIFLNILNRCKKRKEEMFFIDCRNVFLDMYELLNDKKPHNTLLCLDFIELALKNIEIFDNNELKTIFYKIIKGIFELKNSNKENERIKRILYEVIKNKIFIDFTKEILSECFDLVYLFDDDVFTLACEDIFLNEKFIEVCSLFLKSENNEKFDFFVKLYGFLSKNESELEKKTKDDKFDKEDDQKIGVKKTNNNTEDKAMSFDNIDTKELEDTNFEKLFDFFISEFYNYITSSELNKKIDDILIFILWKIIERKKLFEGYLIFILSQYKKFLAVNFCIEARRQIKKEWKYVFAYIENDKECIDFLIEKSFDFNGLELFYLLSGVNSNQIMYFLYSTNIKRIYFFIDCVLVVFLFFYDDLDYLCNFVKDYFRHLREIDKSLETIPFLFIEAKLQGKTVNKYYYNDKVELLEQIQEESKLKYISDNNDFYFNKNTTEEVISSVEICNKSNKISNKNDKIYFKDQKFCIDLFENQKYHKHTEILKDDKIHILNTLSSILRSKGENLIFSWYLILKILDFLCDDIDLIEINFTIFQIISEDFFDFLNAKEKKYFVNLLGKLDSKNKNLNITLQILNVLE
ncbi:hypothetical protein GVAV_002851 [Gurleya vavrai]